MVSNRYPKLVIHSVIQESKSPINPLYLHKILRLRTNNYECDALPTELRRHVAERLRRSRIDAWNLVTGPARVNVGWAGWAGWAGWSGPGVASIS